MNRFRAALCVLLSFQLTAPICSGESAPKLNVVIEEGNGVINDLRQRMSRQTVIRVEDENGSPIPGAAVALALPERGPTGEFSDGSKTVVAMTDERGRVVARILNPVGVGSLQIRVNASYNGRAGASEISQVNMLVPAAKKSSSKWVAILTIAVASAAGAAVAMTRKSGSTNPAGGGAPIGITPGPGTVGPPQ